MNIGKMDAEDLKINTLGFSRNIETTVTLYESLVRSILEYSTVIGSPHPFRRDLIALIWLQGA